MDLIVVSGIGRLGRIFVVDVEVVVGGFFGCKVNWVNVFLVVKWFVK